MGLLGLRQLIYFAETFTSDWLKIVEGQEKSDTLEGTYPVAAAGINISQMLLQICTTERIFLLIIYLQPIPMNPGLYIYFVILMELMIYTVKFFSF